MMGVPAGCRMSVSVSKSGDKMSSPTSFVISDLPAREHE